MVARSGHAPDRPSTPSDRRPGRLRRPATPAPAFECLEGRILLATGPRPQEPSGALKSVTPQQLGAAYQEVAASQTATLNALGDSYRQVQAAALRSSQEATAAIAQLSAARATFQGMIVSDTRAGDAADRRDQVELAAATSAFNRNQQDLGRIQSLAGQAEEGLLISAGIEDQAAVNAKTDIVNGLFTDLQSTVDQVVSEGAAIARRGRQSSAAVVAEIDALAAHLAVLGQPAAPSRSR